jgi:nitrous oxidase accessory protein NosD
MPRLLLPLLPLLVFAAFTVQQRVVEAAVLVVDGDGLGSAADCNDATPAFATITLAIAAASPNDTIEVCPGLYAEQVQINKTLTLLGAQAGVDARTRPFVAANESIIDWPDGPVQVLADNVVIDGFTIQGAVNNPSSPPFSALGAGIWTNPGFSGTGGGHQIFNNIIQDNIIGIYLNHDGGLPGISVAFVERNLIRNNNLPGPAGGTGIYSDLGLHHINIMRNEFSGQTSAAINLAGAPQSNISFSLNELAGGMERVLFSNTSDSIIEENVSVGTTGNAAIRLYGGNDSILITENVLRDGLRGIWLSDLGAGPNVAISASLNCIQGNSVAGLEVAAGAHPGNFNAENNWWGSASGPVHPTNPGGTGDLVIDPDGVVDVLPFLGAPSPATTGNCPPPPLPTPTSKDDCKNGGWMQLADDQGNKFKNQGDCVSYVATQGKNKGAGG